MDNEKSILIVDDEPHLRRTLGLILEEAGYQVACAGSTEEAETYLSSTFFDLIFLDIKLPGKSGTEFLPEIRELYPDLPVLMMTGYATLDTAMAAVRHGARDYILKPFHPLQLLKRVRELLDEKKPPQRRKELVGEIQNLLDELQMVEGRGMDSPELPAPTAADPARLIRCGQLTLNLLTHQANFGERMLHLPPTTFNYLVTLVRHSPNPVSYDVLVQEAQGYAVSSSEAREMAGWHIHELRKNLEVKSSEPKYIITVRNLGYRFVP